MKAYAIATVHYKKNPGNKDEPVTVALANSIIEDLDQKDFDDLVKLGAVREATEVDEARAKALRPPGAGLTGTVAPLPDTQTRLPGASTKTPGEGTNLSGAGTSQSVSEALQTGRQGGGLTTAGISKTGTALEDLV